jgi:hypothetical protein
MTESIAGLSRIIDFFDGREMRVAAVVRALNIRGDVYLRDGNLDGALADARRALDIAQTLQGDKPYSSLAGQALLLMARAHERRGGQAEAHEAAARAVPQLSETLGAGHPDTLSARQQADSNPLPDRAF